MTWGWLKELVNPVMTGLDELVTSDDERVQNENKTLDIKRAIFALETEVQGKLVALELARMEMVTKLAAVEVQSDAWYVKARRPFLELCTFAMLAGDAIGWWSVSEVFEYGGWILLGVNNGLRGGAHVGKAIAGAMVKK